MSSKNIQEILQKRWSESNVLFEEYSKHLRSVSNLSFYELLLVKNFKGGSAVFSESIKDIEKKLEYYFRNIQEFKSKEFAEEQLIKDLFCLIENPKTSIRGFSYSFLSAMLAMFFPETFPIMDWRVLSAKQIVKYDKSLAVYYFDGSKSKNIEYIVNIHPLKLYLQLFQDLTDESRKTGKSLRELDLVYFSSSSLNKVSNS